MPRHAWLSLAALCLAATPALGDGSDIPRTASGRPDLSGVYNVATLTPLQRPKQLEGQASLTDAEAEAIAERWRNYIAKDSAPSDPNRSAPPAGGTEFYIPEFEGAAGGVGGYNAFFVDVGNSSFKLDGAWRTSIIVDPPNGRLPPLSERGMARLTSSRERLQENTGTAWWVNQETGPYDDPEMRPLGERCLLGFGSTSGPPMLPVMYNNLKRIVQTEDTVMILAEMNHDARIIRIDGEHEPDSVRKWMGDSIGHWEGDELVVKTTNFRETTGLMLGSADLRVEERFSRIDQATLRYRFTVEDPNWTASWTGEYPWPATDERVFEYACHEGNYALGGILRGARVLERDALAQQDGSSGR
ncbi:MAG: hypothetical protein OXU70_04670 [Gammaproteobacteria bacterium]|nr:hypothetical protein [Gammaproteobacteria bacterium]